jgi:hypothetical protein
VPFFRDDRSVIPVPENFVELVTFTVAVEPLRVVTVKLDVPTDATVPLTCGGVKSGSLGLPVGVVPLGMVEVGGVAAGEDFETFAVTRPATTPTATTRTATTNHVVRRLRSASGIAPSFERSVMSSPTTSPGNGGPMFPALPVRIWGAL